MSTIKVQAGGQFCIGHYKKSSDAKWRKDIKESLVFNALNKSKCFYVRDWFGSEYRTKFTITNIEKTEYGDYIYTIESNIPTNTDNFPMVLDICKDYEDVASPISYSIL